MPAFKFKLSQCVIVPGLGAVQGRISSCTDFIDAENQYQVTWLDEKLALASAIFKEGDIIAACAAASVATAMGVFKHGVEREAIDAGTKDGWRVVKPGKVTLAKRSPSRSKRRAKR